MVVNDQIWRYPIPGQTPLVQFWKFLWKSIGWLALTAGPPKSVQFQSDHGTQTVPTNFHQPWRLSVRDWFEYDCRVDKEPDSQHLLVYSDALRAQLVLFVFRFDDVG